MKIVNVTTSPATTFLINKGGAVSGNIRKITIANFSDNNNGAVVNLFLNNGVDANDYYFIKNVNIPKGTTLVLEDNVSFNEEVYNLKMYSTGTSPALTVIIK
jgi:hypothetical protein|tara:strand:- start:1604 stop:1909 length:306 start_codon:yes stop_codon:yes gene_type:complete